jgi:hypothetical protein
MTNIVHASWVTIFHVSFIMKEAPKTFAIQCKSSIVLGSVTYIRG